MIEFRNIRNDINNLMDSIFSPIKSYTYVRENSRILTTWIFCSFLITLLNYLTIPFVIRSIEMYLKGKNFPSEYIERTVDFWNHGQKISNLINPFLLLLKWVIIAIIFWLVFQLITSFKEIIYKRILALIANSELIKLISQATNLTVLYFKGFNRIYSLEDVQVKFGLDLLINSENIILKEILKTINIFEIWWVLFLIFGFHYVLNIPKKKTIITVIFVWLFLTILRIGYATIFSFFQIE